MENNCDILINTITICENDLNNNIELCDNPKQTQRHTEKRYSKSTLQK